MGMRLNIYIIYYRCTMIDRNFIFITAMQMNVLVLWPSITVKTILFYYYYCKILTILFILFKTTVFK